LNVEQLAYASEVDNYAVWEQQLQLERRQLQLQGLKQMVALAGEQYLTDVYNDVASRHCELVRQHQAADALARSQQQQQQQVPQPVQQPPQQQAVLILQQQRAALVQQQYLALVHQQLRAALLQQHLLQQQLQACLLLQQQQPQVQQQPMMQVQCRLDGRRERHAAAMRQHRAVQSAEAPVCAFDAFPLDLFAVGGPKTPSFSRPALTRTAINGVEYCLAPEGVTAGGVCMCKKCASFVARRKLPSCVW
jgi:hypothetical protein